MNDIVDAVMEGNITPRKLPRSGIDDRVGVQPRDVPRIDGYPLFISQSVYLLDAPAKRLRPEQFVLRGEKTFGDGRGKTPVHIFADNFTLFGIGKIESRHHIAFRKENLQKFVAQRTALRLVRRRTGAGIGFYADKAPVFR